jgi:hypothetical protein
MKISLVSFQCLLVVFLVDKSIKSKADFVYKNFDETTGLMFRGSTGTTNCGSNPEVNLSITSLITNYD